MRLDGCAYILVHALFYFHSLVSAELLLLRRRRRKEDWVLDRLPRPLLVDSPISLFKCPVESSGESTWDIYITSFRISASKDFWIVSTLWIPKFTNAHRPCDWISANQEDVSRSRYKILCTISQPDTGDSYRIWDIRFIVWDLSSMYVSKTVVPDKRCGASFPTFCSLTLVPASRVRR